MAKIIIGSIFDAPEKYLCHQCNCMTKRAAHLAKDVFAHYPWANIYGERAISGKTDEPGTVKIRGNGTDQRFVIALLGQVYPGRPKFPDSNLDGTLARQKYFKQCLDHLAFFMRLESVAFPWQVGCGAAGGDWGVYQRMIKEYAKKVPDTKVVVYRLPGA